MQKNEIKKSLFDFKNALGINNFSSELSETEFKLISLVAEAQENNYDLKLSEISENYDISRAAVLDTIKRSKKILEDYEKKLQLIKKFHQRKEIYDKIKELKIDVVNQYLEEIEDLD